MVTGFLGLCYMLPMTVGLLEPREPVSALLNLDSFGHEVEFLTQSQ